MRNGTSSDAGNTTNFPALHPATQAETQVTPEIVTFTPEIMPLVRGLENATLENCVEFAVEQLHSGLSYRDFMAGLFLAALRGPAPIAHSVFMLHAAHQLSLEAPMQERLLPTFWALHNFKYWQNWHQDNPDRLRLPQGELPGADKAEKEFRAGVRNSDPEQAQRAIIALARAEGIHPVMELLWHHGAKDNVDIGHNAIAVANCWRVLPTIGWQHMEPMLCWLVPKLMGSGDQSYEPNCQRVAKTRDVLPPNWAQDGETPALTHDLLTLMRDLQTEAACDLAVMQLAQGKAQAGAVWDAVHLHAAELLMHKADVSHPLHANTAANALRYAFRVSSHSETRLLLLLQAVAWQIQHRRRKVETDEAWRSITCDIEQMAGDPIANNPQAAVEETLATLTSQPHMAARQTFALGRDAASAQLFQKAALRLVPAKASPDAHDIKFPISIFEDYHLVSPRWRPHLLAASTHWLQGSDKPDSPVIQQARAALKLETRCLAG